MDHMTLRGVVPPIGTPLLEGDSVDIAGLRRLVDYLLAAGVHGLLANGTMGGFAFLREVEQIRSVATTVEAVNGRIPVIGGLGETSTSRAVPLARQIAAEGVDAISILPPLYYYANQQHLIAYFSEIAAAVDLPIYLYDNPALTKNNILPETVAALHNRIPRLQGMKVSNPDFVNLQTLIRVMRDTENFSIFTGSEFLIVAALQLGCKGFVGGLHNITPHLAVALYDAFERGDLNAAREHQQSLIEAWRIFTHGAIWGAFDEALRWLGICERATGAPYDTAVTDAEREAIHAILATHARPFVGTLSRG